MTRVRRLFDLLGASAEAHGLHAQVVGYAKTPQGSGAKINELRGFVQSRRVDSEDVIVFAGAVHVLVFAKAEQILAGFAEMERLHNASVFFNAVPWCSPSLDGLCEDYPPSPTRWRYLDSGLIAGRAWALRELLRDPVPEGVDGGDQAWYQRQFRRGGNATRLLAIDRECRLLCAVADADPGVVLGDGGRMVRRDTGHQPSLVSFPGAGHWMRWPEGQNAATSILLTTFRRAYPDVAERTVDAWKLELHIGSTHDIKIYGGAARWSSVGAALCVRCNLLGSSERECEYFDGFLCNRCASVSLLALSFLMFALPCCALTLRSILRGGSAPVLPFLRGRRPSKPADLIV